MKRFFISIFVVLLGFSLFTSGAVVLSGCNSQYEEMVDETQTSQTTDGNTDNDADGSEDANQSQDGEESQSETEDQNTQNTEDIDKVDETDSSTETGETDASDASGDSSDEETASSQSISGYWTDSSNYSGKTITISSSKTSYDITCEADLAYLSYYVGSSTSNHCAGMNFYLKANLDMSAHYWEPIGGGKTTTATAQTYYFSGSFYGSGYMIDGLITDGSAYYCGLFGCVYNNSSTKSYIEKVFIGPNSDIKGLGYCGAIAGRMWGNFNVYRCANFGKVTTTSVYSCGGIVGAAHYGGYTFQIYYCYNTGTVTGAYQYNGGIVGNLTASGLSATSTSTFGMVYRCYNTGTVTSPSSNFLGGIIGAVSVGSSTTSYYAYFKVYACYNTGSITETDGESSVYFGGIIGGTVSNYAVLYLYNCINFGTISRTHGGSTVTMYGVIGSAPSTFYYGNLYQTRTSSGVSYCSYAYVTSTSDIIEIFTTSSYWSSTYSWGEIDTSVGGCLNYDDGDSGYYYMADWTCTSTLNSGYPVFRWCYSVVNLKSYYTSTYSSFSGPSNVGYIYAEYYSIAGALTTTSTTTYNTTIYPLICELNIEQNQRYTYYKARGIYTEAPSTSNYTNFSSTSLELDRSTLDHNSGSYFDEAGQAGLDGPIFNYCILYVYVVTSTRYVYNLVTADWDTIDTGNIGGTVTWTYTNYQNTSSTETVTTYSSKVSGVYLLYGSSSVPTCTVTATANTGYKFVGWYSTSSPSSSSSKLSTSTSFSYYAGQYSTVAALFVRYVTSTIYVYSRYTEDYSTLSGGGGTISWEYTKYDDSTSTTSVTSGVGVGYGAGILYGSDDVSTCTLTATASSGYLFVGYFWGTSSSITSYSSLSSLSTNTTCYYAAGYYTYIYAVFVRYVNATSYVYNKYTTNWNDLTAGSTGGSVTWSYKLYTNVSQSAISVTSSTSKAASTYILYGSTSNYSSTVTATANSGYTFIGWYSTASPTSSSSAISTSTTFEYVAGTYTTVCAVFMKLTDVTVNVYYTIDYNTYTNGTTGGSVSTSGSSSPLYYGKTLKLTATAATGYQFAGWMTSEPTNGTVATVSATTNPYSVTISATTFTIYALFVKYATITVGASYTTNYSSFSTGSSTASVSISYTDLTGTAKSPTSITSGSYTVLYGKSVTLTATAGTGYKFVGWVTDVPSSSNCTSVDSCTSTDNPLGISAGNSTTAATTEYTYYAVVAGVSTITAYIRYTNNWTSASTGTTGGSVKISYTIFTNKSSGTITASDSTAYYALGNTTVKFTATAASGYKFIGWTTTSPSFSDYALSTSTASTSTTYSFTASSTSYNIYAVFAPILDFDGTYWYYEDGEYPQTYYGPSVSGLSSTASYTLTIGGVSVPVYALSSDSNTKYAAVTVNGTTAYFTVEPIKWIVFNASTYSTNWLSDDTIRVVSRDVLTYGAVNNVVSNTISISTAGGWEVIGIPVTVSTNTTYTLTFNYKMPEYTALSGYDAFRVMVLYSTPSGADCTNRDLAYVDLESESEGSASVTFSSGSYTTIYIVLNFGYVADGYDLEFEFSNFQLHDSSGNAVTIESNVANWTGYAYSSAITDISTCYTSVSVSEGWNWTESTLYSWVQSSAVSTMGYDNYSTATSITYSGFGSGTTQGMGSGTSYVVNTSAASAGSNSSTCGYFTIASVDEIGNVAEAFCAKCSDLVAFIASEGSTTEGYSIAYWTRDLAYDGMVDANLNNGVYITASGLVRGAYLTNSFGARFSTTFYVEYYA